MRRSSETEGSPASILATRDWLDLSSRASCLLVIAVFLVSSSSIPFARNRFPCLPNGMKLSRAVECDTTAQPGREITLEETLVKMGARCKKGKLVDAKGKEIRFYTVQGFGAPTAYAMETMRRQRIEIEALKRKYTVIEIPSRDRPCEPIP